MNGTDFNCLSPKNRQDKETLEKFMNIAKITN